MKERKIKLGNIVIIAVFALFLSRVNFIAAQEEEEVDSLNQVEQNKEELQPEGENSVNSIEEQEDTVNSLKLQEKLELLEKASPVGLNLESTENLISGSEIKIAAIAGVVKPINSSDLEYKWTLKKNGIDQDVPLSNQGKGRDLFTFVPISNGNYEVKVVVTDSAGNARESQPFSIPVGDNLLIDFEPLKPTNGQKVKVSVASFGSVGNYQWFLDGNQQDENSSLFEFAVTKSYEQTHNVKVRVVNKNGILTQKELLVPVYRPELVIRPAGDVTRVAGQANTLGEFMIKGDDPVSLRVDTNNMVNPDKANYAWYINDQKIEEGVGKKNVVIDPRDERLRESLDHEYTVSVLASSADLKDVASGRIDMYRIADTSSFASVEPEKISTQPLVAESQSFFNSFNLVRKLAIPVMVLMFIVIIAFANTQPDKIEEE